MLETYSRLLPFGVYGKPPVKFSDDAFGVIASLGDVISNMLVTRHYQVIVAERPESYSLDRTYQHNGWSESISTAFPHEIRKVPGPQAAHASFELNDDSGNRVIAAFASVRGKNGTVTPVPHGEKAMLGAVGLALVDMLKIIDARGLTKAMDKDVEFGLSPQEKRHQVATVWAALHTPEARFDRDDMITVQTKAHTADWIRANMPGPAGWNRRWINEPDLTGVAPLETLYSIPRMNGVPGLMPGELSPMLEAGADPLLKGHDGRSFVRNAVDRDWHAEVLVVARHICTRRIEMDPFHVGQLRRGISLAGDAGIADTETVSTLRQGIVGLTRADSRKPRLPLPRPGDESGAGLRR